MGVTYSELEDRIRRHLGDTGTPPLLSAADLDRHIDHAARDMTLIGPVDLLIQVNAVARSRVIDPTQTMANYAIVRIDAVEWKVGNYPQTFVQFSLFDKQLTLLVEGAASAADPVNLYCQAAVQVSSITAQSTVPFQWEDVLEVGAAGYAAEELGTRLINAVNVGGQLTSERYLQLGDQHLQDFGEGLRILASRRQINVRRLYAPHYPATGMSQSTVYPPDPGLP